MKKIYLVDGNSFIYRMFYALPEFSTKSGVIVNAVFGMAKFFVGQLIKENPDYLVFVKDAKGENFRHKIYADYKATRDRMPDNLKSQIALIEEMIGKMGIEIVEIPGFEADDVIGTLATSLGKNKENEVFILSIDKDLFSLTTENVKIYDTQKNKIYDHLGAEKKFGVTSKKIIDYLAIVGDSSDNIPGIAGFGPKKAVDLLQKYDSIEQVFEHIEDTDFMFKGKTLEKLVAGKEDGILSKELATIDLGVDIPEFKIENFKFKAENILNTEIIDFFKKYEFKSLVPDEHIEPQKKVSELDLEIEIISTDAELEKIENEILKVEVIIIDVKTQDFNDTKNIVGIGIDNFSKKYYINFSHTDSGISPKFFKNFLQKILLSDLKIIGYDLKNQLKILEQNFNMDKTETKNSQIGFGF